MRGWLQVFIPAFIATSIITFVNFWQITHAVNLSLFGIKFSSIWKFWLAYCALTAIVFYPANYLFAYAYWYGYNVVFPGKAWRVQEIFWFSGILAMFISSWLYLGELPTRNALIALAFLIGALLAIIWK